jgi:hypothetical protein
VPFAPTQSVSAAEQASLDAKADKPTTITKNVDYTLTATDSIILATGGGSGITLTVPLTTGIRRDIKKVDAGAGPVTVVPSSGTIEGAASLALVAQRESVTLLSDGTDLYVV